MSGGGSAGKKASNRKPDVRALSLSERMEIFFPFTDLALTLNPDLADKKDKQRGLCKFFETGNLAGIQPDHRQKLRIRLIALDTATCIEDMNTPGWRLHSLKGDRQGLWAIDVNRKWRIVFEFKDGDAYIVDYEDYH